MYAPVCIVTKEKKIFLCFFRIFTVKILILHNVIKIIGNKKETQPENNKYIVSCFGDIDAVKHKKLIEESLQKYGDTHGIFF